MLVSIVTEYNQKVKEKNKFYQDQYETREIRLRKDKIELDQEQKEKEKIAGEQLKEKVNKMTHLFNK